MPRGFGGGGFRGGGFGRGGYGMRRGGMPLLGMGGMGMGMGLGPLFNGLLTGGLGFLLGRSSNQQVYQQSPPYYQQSQDQQAAPASADTLSQLKLLGELHDSGVLTDEEFTREKNRILGH